MLPDVRIIAGVLNRGWALERRAAERHRQLAIRLIRGENLAEGDFRAVFPRAWDDDEDCRHDLHEAQTYELVGSVAIIHIDGPLSFAPDWIDLLFGVVPWACVVQALDHAAADPSVETALLRLNTPGGTVNGWADAKASIERFKATGKKLHAIAHEGAFSMGMRLAAQCDEFAISPTGECGSIGTLIPMYDTSKMFEEAGVTPFMIQSHPTKSVGWPGVPLTEENTDDLKRIVAADYEEFLSEVEAGRGIEKKTLRELGARVFGAEDAKKLELADRVVVYAEYVSELSGQGPKEALVANKLDELLGKNPEAQKELDERIAAGVKLQLEAAKPKPATVGELKAAFPGDENAGFCLECVEKSLTLEAAKAAHAGVLVQRLEAANAKVAEAQKRVTDLEKLGDEGTGTDPVGAGPEREAGGKDPFEKMVEGYRAQNVKAGDNAMVANGKAWRTAVAEHPEEHEKWKERQAERGASARKARDAARNR